LEGIWNRRRREEEGMGCDGKKMGWEEKRMR
jgi:hypothetical protein